MFSFEKLAEKMLPVANAIGNQRHMQAIRNGLISILPLTIVGSFFVILLNIPIKGYMDFIAPYRDMLDVPFRFTVGWSAPKPVDKSALCFAQVKLVTKLQYYH